MPVSTATRPIYNYVQFGESRVDTDLETHKMTINEFEVLGCKVLTHLKERKSDFKYATDMFIHFCTGLMELGVYLILEELSILIEEMENDHKAVDQLKQIYNALKLQAYTERRVVAQLVA